MLHFNTSKLDLSKAKVVDKDPSDIRCVEVEVIPYRKMVLYEISEDELERLGKYQATDLFLNLGSISLSSFVTILVAISTVKISSSVVFCTFFSCMLIMLLSSVTFFALYWLSRKKRQQEIDLIKNCNRS